MPIKKIVDLAKEKNIPVLVDGTQGAPHLKIDIQELDCDFYAISCHKMYGPNGLGILYAKKKWLDELPPYQGGGGMISEVLKDKVSFAKSKILNPDFPGIYPKCYWGRTPSSVSNWLGD